jgi:hypothetical protein
MALLAASRPTAVNLFWALRRMDSVIKNVEGPTVAQLLAEAQAIHQEDIAANQRMGELGAALLGERTAVLTHCNAGALATGGYGTALGVIRSGFAAGLIGRVYADETRPWLQGARLTAWELVQDGIPVTLLADGRQRLDASGQSALGDRRRGSDCGQRRCRQQDRHLSSGGGRPLSRRAVHGGGAGLDRGCEPSRWNRYSHRTTRRGGATELGRTTGGGGWSRGLESIVRCDPSGIGRCLGHGTRCGAGARRGEDARLMMAPANERLTIRGRFKSGRAQMPLRCPPPAITA